LPDQAVIAYLKLSGPGFGDGREVDRFQPLEDQLERAIEQVGVGEFDGDDFGEGECILYMYGPNADALFAVVEPVLRASPLSLGGRAVKQYGEPGAESAPDVTVAL
jgi:hypothetical protein